MEIVALITINIAFGVGLYIVVSAKLTKILKESQTQVLEKKIRTIQAEFIRNTEMSFEILEHKTRGLRDLLERSDRILEILKEESGAGNGVSIQLQNLINQVKYILDGRSLSDISNGKLTETLLSSYLAKDKKEESLDSQISNDSESLFESQPAVEPQTSLRSQISNKSSSMSINDSIDMEERKMNILANPLLNQAYQANNRIARGVSDAYLQNKVTKTEEIEESAIGNISTKLIAGLGRKVFSMIGGDKAVAIDSSQTRAAIPKPSVTKTFKYVVDGDPFEDLDANVQIRDIEEEKRLEDGSFLSTFKSVTQPPSPKDQIVISPNSVLEELPPSATKIDKVVLLLKKGYSYEEIADTLDIGTREVKLIETIRMDKSRRR